MSVLIHSPLPCKVNQSRRGKISDDVAADSNKFREGNVMENQGLVLWLTGLSGAGKTTIARGVEHELKRRACLVEVLDGDVMRTNLCKGLGFSREDRETNIRRIGFVANLLSRNGVIAIAAVISPYRSIRDEIRDMSDRFMEVYVNAPLEVCEARDPKGLYAMARAGELLAFTGIDDPYEPPLEPDLVCHTDIETPEESIRKIVDKLEYLELVPPPPHVEFFI